MKIYDILVVYGKNKSYYCNDYVCEDAIEQYKEEIIRIKNEAGRYKNITFINRGIRAESYDGSSNSNSYCTISAYTKNGFKNPYRIN